MERNSSENGQIKRIIDTVQKLGDQWSFGFALGVPVDDLNLIIDKRQTSTPSMTMCEIFSTWDRKVVDRSWKQVFYALNAIKYQTLKNDIEVALTNLDK